MSTAEQSRKYRLEHPESAAEYNRRRRARRDAARAERQKIVEKCPYCWNDFHPFDNHGNKRHPTCGSDACKMARALALQRDRFYAGRGEEAPAGYVPKHVRVEGRSVPAKIVRTKIVRTCKVCGKEFEAERVTQCTCSDACRARNKRENNRRLEAAHRAPRATLVCAYCGKTFPRVSSTSKYCSVECRRAHGISQRKAEKIQSGGLTPEAASQVARDMRLPAAARFKAQKRWSKEQREYAKKLYIMHHRLFTPTYNP